jgi:hypothetical protein
MTQRDAAEIFPQKGGHRVTVRLAGHRVLEALRGDHLVTGESRRTDDADAHRGHQLVHLGNAAIRSLGSAVRLESRRVEPPL